MNSEEDLDQLVKNEALRNGISSKDAKKALKKLKAGGMMAQIAPHLHNQFMEMNPNMSPKEKLRMKMNKMRESRSNKSSKTKSYEKTKQEVYDRQQKEKEDKEKKTKQEAQRRKNHRKKIKELGKKLGDISQEQYNECMRRISENTYKDHSEKNRDKNIVELYGIQQSFNDTLDMDELDNI